jgi:HEAT repeat protein
MADTGQNRRILSLVGAIALALSISPAARAEPVDAVFRAVAHYRYGDPRQPLSALAELVRQANSAGADDARGVRRGLAERMASLLTSAEATPAAKAFVCAQLGAIGTERQAPALVSLLADKELAPAALAALAQVPGPAVDSVLRDALGRFQGDLKVGVINALGQRRDRAAVEPLAALLAGADCPSASAAASALGKIGGDRAAAELEKALRAAKGQLRAEIADACLACAERMLAEKNREGATRLYFGVSIACASPQSRMAAFRGVALAKPERSVTVVCDAVTSGDPALESIGIHLVPEIPGHEAALRFALLLATVPPPMKTPLLGALASRGDVAARYLIERVLISTNDAEVRRAALTALGTCGDHNSVRILLDWIVADAGTAEGEAALSSLLRLRGPRVNEFLIGMVRFHRNPAVRTKVIHILAARNAVDVMADLKKLTQDPERAVRRETWKALGAVTRGSDVGAVLDLLVRVEDYERDEAEQAAAAVLKRPDQPDVRSVLDKLDAAPGPAARVSLIRVVSALGDDRALPALRKAVRSGEAEVRDAAVRGLAAWPTPAPFDDLVELARSAGDSAHRILAFRGALRLVSKLEGRTPEQKTRLVAQLAPLAGAAAERKAVLAELGRCPTLEALRLAQEYLDDPQLATEAGVAVAQIASAIGRTHRDEARKALTALLTGKRDPAVVERAAQSLKDLGFPAQ